MLVIPAFKACMQSALIRANIKPPVELVVANLEFKFIRGIVYMLNLSEEQQKALMETVNKHIQEEAKKSLDAFDKTLDRKVSLV